MKRTLASAYIVMALAVILGAFGAHALEDLISEQYMDTYKTANFYHFIHGLGMIITSYILNVMGSKRALLISNMFLLGIVLFSGSLYILSVWEVFEEPALRKLGAVTPVGGIVFILAWLTASVEFIKLYRWDKRQNVDDPSG